MRWIWIVVITALTSLVAAESQPIPISTERGFDFVRTELCLAKTGLRAMSVAAHPDDEDGATLSYLRRTLGIETHTCLATRGEGGQNELGPEVGNELAVLRTKETESAAKILGSKVWYLNLPDFGYSKSAEETFSVWQHDHALEQLVRVIRLVRPHILFTHHDPNGKDHGHHVATGKLLVEAFDAAADPTRFASKMQDDGTQPWAVSKLYLRDNPPAIITLVPPKPMFNIYQCNPLSGLSPMEIAALALQQHASQGMQRSIRVGENEFRTFTLLKSRVETKDDTLMSSNLPVASEKFSAALTSAISAITKTPDDPAHWVTQIAEVIARVDAEKIEASTQEHLLAALREALGLRTEVTVSDSKITYDESVSCTLRVANAGVLPLKLALAHLRGENQAWKTEGEAIAPDGKSLECQSTLEWKCKAEAREGAFPTWPRSQMIFSRIQTRTPLRIEALFKLTLPEGKTFQFSLNESVHVDLAPQQTVTVSPDPVLIFDNPLHEEDVMILARIRLAVTNHRNLKEPLKLFGGVQPINNTPVENWATFTFQKRDEMQYEEFRFLAHVAKLEKGTMQVPMALWSTDKNFGGPMASLRRVPIKFPPILNVALVKTHDNSTYDALKRLEDAGLGLTVTLLSADDLRTAILNRYHTIILDTRATQFRSELRNVRERLKQFMNDGGNILCFYHKDFDWNLADGKQSLRGQNFFKGESGGGEIAPYPIELSFDRVTDQNAPVKMLKPDHPLMNEPCKIYERDFEGWVQERGVYFPKKWAPEYTPLLSTHDAGEAPLEGGLLVADVGRGSFIYTSFVWHRQLRAGVPGAYRMLANMVSYPRVKRPVRN